MASNKNYLESLFNHLPAASATLWIMVTPYFNRPIGEQCDTGLKIGLGVISAVIGLFCWLRSAITLYSARCVRRHCNKGLLWFSIAVVEAAAITALFASIVLVTPPGSTCFFPNGYTGNSTIDTFITYNILGGAAVLSFAVPKLLGWLMAACELLGIRVRPDPQASHCAASPGMASNLLFGAEQSSPVALKHSQPLGPALEPPAGAAAAARPGLLRWLFDNNRLQYYVWQLLPAATVTLYQVVTAYWSSSTSPEGCSRDEKIWLIVFVSVVGVMGFFVTVESYEKEAGTSSGNLLFRTRGLGYRLGALAAALFTSGTFVVVALLTPPGALCFFPSQYQGNEVQFLATILLPAVAASLLLAALLRAASKPRRDDWRVQQVSAHSAPVHEALPPSTPALSPSAPPVDAMNAQHAQFVTHV